MIIMKLLTAYQAWSLMKKKKKSESNPGSKAKINCLHLKLLPFNQTLNITGSKLMLRKVTRLLLLKEFSELKTLTLMLQTNFLFSKWLATILFKTVLFSLTTYQEKLLMFLQAPENTEKGLLHGRRTKDGTKDGISKNMERVF